MSMPNVPCLTWRSSNYAWLLWKWKIVIPAFTVILTMSWRTKLTVCLHCLHTNCWANRIVLWVANLISSNVDIWCRKKAVLAHQLSHLPWEKVAGALHFLINCVTWCSVKSEFVSNLARHLEDRSQSVLVPGPGNIFGLRALPQEADL